MEDRSNEFERLRLVQMKDAKENAGLKTRLQEMKVVNDSEKQLLEQQVCADDCSQYFYQTTLIVVIFDLFSYLN